ncbi:hypothetical protein ACJX0J_007543 [Zea mays]
MLHIFGVMLSCVDHSCKHIAEATLVMLYVVHHVFVVVFPFVIVALFFPVTQSKFINTLLCFHYIIHVQNDMEGDAYQNQRGSLTGANPNVFMCFINYMKVDTVTF